MLKFPKFKYRWTILAVAAFVFFGLIYVASFYFTAPSATRVVAQTGSFSFVVPHDPSVADKLAMPIDHGLICERNSSGDSFEVEQTTDYNCPAEDDALSGTLWLLPGSFVSTQVWRDNAEITIDRPDGAPDRTDDGTDDSANPLVFRTHSGNVIELSYPVKIRLPASNHHEKIVLPLLSEHANIGRPYSWQALTSEPILQSGDVTLIRKSVFGNRLFDMEEFPLSLGDLVVLKSTGKDFIQGVIQIELPGELTVSLTAKNSEAELFRMAQDSVKLNSSLASHAARDPSLIITWVLLSFLIATVIGWLQIKF